jgi:uncharacterized membrane protein
MVYEKRPESAQFYFSIKTFTPLTIFQIMTVMLTITIVSIAILRCKRLESFKFLRVYLGVGILGPNLWLFFLELSIYFY